MIKLAFMTSVCPDWDLEQIFAAMERYGFDGLEPRVGWSNRAGIQVDMPADARKALRKRMEDKGKQIPCIATGCRFALPDDTERAKQIDEARVAIDLAADLGAPCIRTFGGEHGGGEMHPIVERTAVAYLEVLGHARDRGVVLLLETHDSWCNSAHVRAVVERVDDPNLRVLWDLMHPARMFERPEETMAIIGRLTAHLHAHDGRYTPEGRLETVPLGEGTLDHSTPIRLLSESGYDGFVSVEVIHKPGSDHDPDPVLKQYAGALHAMVQQA